MGRKSVLLNKPAVGHHLVPLVHVDRFGKDHWSVFGYAECRIVDHDGVPDRRHMRCNPKRHPQFAHVRWHTADALESYATRLRGDVIAPHHDDWDCVQDLVNAGLMEEIGTGINPHWKLTERGKQIAAQLRQWKGDGGTFATFQPEDK